MEKRNKITHLMKNVLILYICFLFSSCFSSYDTSYYYKPQVPKEDYLSLCVNLDGYWGEWKNVSYNMKIRGGYSGFIIYDKEDGPWNYIFKFSIDQYVDPSLDTKLKHYQGKEWYVYHGTVEYYISDDYLTIYDAFKSANGPRFVSAVLKDNRPVKKITSRATIKIAPYAPSSNPKCYNLWFDNVALGIDLNDLTF